MGGVCGQWKDCHCSSGSLLLEFEEQWGELQLHNDL